MKKIAALLLFIAFAGRAAAAVMPEPVPAHRVTFAFHSAFLMNLHHFLYDMAVHENKLAGVAWQAMPTEGELRTLRRAIGFYRAHYAARGIREDPAMIGIKQTLSVEDGRRGADGLGLPPALAAELDAVAPMYAKYLWPVHDGSNRRWIARVKIFDAAYGAEIQAGVERHLGAPFPVAPIRVDVVFETGSRQGAYTDEQVVIPSARADYQGMTSLEMLYHEAAHTTVTTPLEEVLRAQLEASGRDPDSDLWHAVQFYTVGAVTREVFARHGAPGYRPYADKRGLYDGPWAPFMPAIETAWREHMAGRIDLRQAARRMVDRLPAR